MELPAKLAGKKMVVFIVFLRLISFPPLLADPLDFQITLENSLASWNHQLLNSNGKQHEKTLQWKRD